MLLNIMMVEERIQLVGNKNYEHEIASDARLVFAHLSPIFGNLQHRGNVIDDSGFQGVLHILTWSYKMMQVCKIY
jgi:hypothetical protein